jgi:hypothetical protein
MSITIDVIALIALVVAALVGYFFGFGRTLKWFTGGIVGIVIAVVACIMLGGIFQNIGFVQNFILNINDRAAGVWGGFGQNFLRHFAGQLAFYAIMFLVVMLIKIILVRVVKKLMQSENGAMKILNKVLGVVFMAGFVSALILVILAGIKTLGVADEYGLYTADTFFNGLINNLGDGVLRTVFDNNPIKFVT